MPSYRSSGVLKPEEMCLVLGCPGAGCTMFLKAISFVKISGKVSYAGIDVDEMTKHYNGEVVFNQEDLT